jgi:hypothetical protein
VIAPTARRLATAAVAAALLAGCAAIPTSSAPRVVEKLDRDRGAGDQGVVQDTRPGPGATETQIVDGFIRAQPAWQRGHEPARRFLTTRAAARWHDDTRMFIASGAPKVGLPGPNHVIPVTFTAVGEVGRDGSYLPVLNPADAAVTWNLPLKKEHGEWRIDQLPDEAGIVLSRGQFDLYYRPYTLYFLDPSGGRLVPDRRYLPNDPGTLLYQLVRRLTDGPSGWLLPVVHNDLALPVSLNRVRAEGSVVRVDLAALNALTYEDRLGAVAQLVWTVSQLPSVFGVQVTSDGQRADLRDVSSAPLGTTDMSRYDPDALPDSAQAGPSRPDPQPTRTGGTGEDTPAGIQAYYVRGGRVFTLDGTAVLGAGYGLTAVGVSTDLLQLAGVGPAPTGSGQTLWVGRVKGPLRPSPLRAATLSRPTWDRATGTFWTVADGGKVRSVGPDGEVRAVRLDDRWLPERLTGIGPLRLARDGTRVAFAAGRPGHQRLYVGRVHSTSDAVTIENPVPITPALVDVRDVAWESASILVVLGARAGGRIAPWRVQADGSSAEPISMPVPEITGMMAITAAPDGPPVIAGVDGTLWINQGSWVSPTGKGTVYGGAPSYPG